VVIRQSNGNNPTGSQLPLKLFSWQGTGQGAKGEREREREKKRQWTSVSVPAEKQLKPALALSY